MARSSPFGELTYRVGSVTATMVVVIGVASILAAILGTWLGAFSLTALAAFMPDAVLHGQLWRLATYPWITGDPIGLIFSIWILWFLGPAMHSAWGTRKFVTRLMV